MKQRELTHTFMMISVDKKAIGVHGLYTNIKAIYPLTAKLLNLNFHPREVVSR